MPSSGCSDSAVFPPATANSLFTVAINSPLTITKNLGFGNFDGSASQAAVMTAISVSTPEPSHQPAAPNVTVIRNLRRPPKFTSLRSVPDWSPDVLDHKFVEGFVT